MVLMLSYLIHFVIAATHPLTGSSIINNPTNSLALSQMGFSVGQVPDDWVYYKTLDDSAKAIEIGTDKKTLLTFRSENVAAKTQFEPFVRQYLRDYNQYGFDVVGLESIKNPLTPTIIVDLKQKNKSYKSRQVFFYKPGQIIVATCADEASQFQKTFAICNKILNSFQWKTN